MKKGVLIIAGIALLSACKKADIEAPVLSEIQINNSSQSVQLHPGESFSVSGTVTDNKELNQFKIDIHHDFDGHSHKSMTTRYEEIRISDISGTSYSINESFTVPDNASSGTYHGTITSLDKEGNQSENKLFYFEVISPDQPVMNLTVPTSVTAGNDLVISGTITGTVFLSQVFVKATSLSNGNTLINESYSIASSELMTWDAQTDGNLSILIPSGESGPVKIRIRAEDSNGNNTIFEQQIVVN